MKKIYLTFILVLLAAYEGYSQSALDPGTTRTVITNGVGLGTVLAGVTSWERNKSVLWAIIHGILSWLYVIYFVITRRRNERK